MKTVPGLFGGYLTPAEIEERFRNERHWHVSAMPADYRDGAEHCYNTPLGIVAVNNKFKIPDTGGISVDAQTVYFDPSLPQFLELGGQLRDVWQFLVIHERVEGYFMDQGMTYEGAHDIATVYEHAAVRSCGLDPAEYEAVLKPFIVADLHESGADMPADLNRKPYAHSKLRAG